jgi:tetratricopeptide (TPR) repeat protein
LLQFRGVFERGDDQLGAKAYLLRARTPDIEIEKFDTQADQLPESSPLLQRLPGDAKQRQAIIQELMQEAKRLAIVSKQHASYWLGLIHFDSGDYDVAIDYFQIRTLAANPDGPWTHGARYNLGRSYEAIGMRDRRADVLRKARDIYLSDDASPQALGNRVRARRIESILASM